HGVIGPDFLRVGGSSVNGAIAPAGPLMVANQLPDSNPIKKVALKFFKDFEAKYPRVRNSFAGYSYDAFLLIEAAAKVALKKAKPGTVEFRIALRDALEATNGVVGTHAVYGMSKDDHNGVDKRAVVLVTVQKGAFQLLKD
ncbi:MAG: branched-chain amino acid ABC transporter substrate-binding protein, partial [Bauldia litoralis]